MTDDIMIDETQDTRRRRARLALGLVLALLMLLLAVAGLFLVKTLTPPGAPTHRFAASGLSWVRSIYGYGPKQDQQFYRPTDVAVAPDGTIWGTDPESAFILGFNPDGTFKGLIHVGPPAKGAGRMMLPEGIGTDDQGNVYVADYGNEKIMVFTPTNRLVREWPVPKPMDVAVHGDRVAVSTVYGVALFDLAGNRLTYWGTRGKGADQFDIAHGVAFGPQGQIYVADTQNKRVKAYTESGKLLWISRGATSKTGSAAKSGFQIPSSVAVDGRGRIAVVDAFDFSVKILDPVKGTYVGTYGTYGQQDGKFVYPTGVAYDPQHDWFVVADTENDRLQVVRIPGSAPLLASISAGLRRDSLGSMWLFSIPLVLLLLAIALLAWRRRRECGWSDEAGLDETEPQPRGGTVPSGAASAGATPAVGT